MSLNISTTPMWAAIDNMSKTLSHTPVTKTTSNLTGDETLTDGTPVNIQGAFFKKESLWAQKNIGLLNGADGILIVKPDVTLTKNDKVTWDGEIYRIDSVTDRYMAETHFYDMARLFKNA